MEALHILQTIRCIDITFWSGRFTQLVVRRSVWPPSGRLVKLLFVCGFKLLRKPLVGLITTVCQRVSIKP